MAPRGAQVKDMTAHIFIANNQGDMSVISTPDSFHTFNANNQGFMSVNSSASYHTFVTNNQAVMFVISIFFRSDQ